MYEVPFWGSGVNFWRYHPTVMKSCQKNRWANLLLINNFYPEYFDEGCFQHTWIFCLEFQFFLVALAMSAIFWRNRTVAYILNWVFIIGGILFGLLMTKFLGIGPSSKWTEERYQSWFYSKPWTRFGTYGLGITVGFMFFEYAKSERFPELQDTKATRFFNWMRGWSALTNILSLIVCIVACGFLTLWAQSWPYDKHVYPEEIWE